VQDKWALEEHLSTPENNELWDDSGEAARNGKQYMDDVESQPLTPPPIAGSPSAAGQRARKSSRAVLTSSGWVQPRW
jgi:hypothetical protein